MRLYRRTTYIVALGGLAAALLLGGCAAVGEEAQVTPAEGSTTAGTTSTENNEGSQSVAKVGDTLTLKGTAYKVTKVRTTTKVGSDFAEVNADGVFVVVNLTLTDVPQAGVAGTTLLVKDFWTDSKGQIDLGLN
jgi:hypothetical protein